MILIILSVVFLVIIFFYVSSFNRLTAARQNVTEGWAGIDVQLKRRYDLIPNLVRVVKEYTAYEKNLFEHIAEIRAEALRLGENDIKGKSSIEKDVETNIKSLFAIAESNPELKANTNYLKLQEELSQTEDQIASSRRIYNSNVADYNTLVLTIPTNIIATLHHFTVADFFENK